MIAISLLSLLLPAFVSAHGILSKVVIDGTTYQGNSAGTTASMSSVIRQVSTNSPVKGASNPFLNCGQDAQLAASVANANPGSTVQVYWIGGTSSTSGDSWPHNTGPIMHYMAKCDGSCATYNSSNAMWFKISELGQKPGGSTWYQADLQSGSPMTVTLPQTLAPGNYMLRSEIIALQLAMSPGGAEFYPACVQLSVGGSQSSQPMSSEEVTLPGAYSDSDPGILTPNVYNPGFTYVFPGPPVAQFASGNSSSGSSGGSGTPSTPAMSSPSAGPSSMSGPAMPSMPANGTPSIPTMSSPAASSPSMSGPSTYPMPSMPANGTPSNPTMSGLSTYPMPSMPANAGGNPLASAPSSAPSGGSSSCMRKRSIPQPRLVVKDKRMHRHRSRTAH